MLNDQQNNVNNQQIELLHTSLNKNEAFLQDKYQITLKQISKMSQQFSFLFIIEILSSLALIIYALVVHPLSILFIVSVASQVLYTVLNIISFKLSLKKPDTNSKKIIIKLFFKHFLLSVLQVDFILFYKNCKEQIKQVTIFEYKKIQLSILQCSYNNLVKWHTLRRFYLAIKCFIHLGFLILNQKNEMNINENILIYNFAFSTTLYLFYNHFYVKTFVFQKQLTFEYDLLILFELKFQFGQSLSYLIATIYLPELRIAAICIILLYITIIKCQLEHQLFFDQLRVDLIHYFVFGQKLTFISTLYNQDIFQVEMIFNNVFNIIQFGIAQIYFIVNIILIFYNSTTIFPEYLIIIQVIILIITIITIPFKMKQIKNLYSQDKSYFVDKISQLQERNVSSKKMKLEIFSQQKLEERDWPLIENYFKIDSQQFQLSLTYQFQVTKILSYSILEIYSFKVACLNKVFNQLLLNSSSIQIQILPRISNKQIVDKIQAKQFLFNSLKSISYEDHVRCNINNSNLIKYFSNEKYFEQLNQILCENSYKKIMINTVAYYKLISQYQPINSAMILLDLYEIYL